MLFLASRTGADVVPFREIARRMEVPEDFLAKILKLLVRGQLVASTRGVHGGYRLARAPSDISFLDVMEAVEGPIQVNHCTSTHVHAGPGCDLSQDCTMFGVWRLGQERMLQVYREAKLDKLAMRGLTRAVPEGGLALTVLQ